MSSTIRVMVGSVDDLAGGGGGVALDVADSGAAAA